MRWIAIFLAMLPVQVLAQEIYDPTFSNPVYIPGFVQVVVCRYEFRYELIGYRTKWVQIGRCLKQVKEPVYRQVLVQICCP